ncbi:3'-5' exonuclease [Roseivirga misakiensis]|uniref:3'-5' exonuclease n=1 Tax=Roseivirga misakiensis TaxID=1563681 RepID=A0A1E5T396_9BACT|nr:3'-5' exonuclease [Roseivirga misakiensis]OEK05811.1 3'-5' exonuclease [Roseivirga misakiensis]
MLNLYNILFLDIETVATSPQFENLSDRFKTLWEKKAKFLDKSGLLTPADLYQQAGIYAEFGKIVSIAVGYFTKEDNPKLRIKAFSNDNEKDLLKEFSSLISQKFDSESLRLCAHNGKEFDFPYLSRRLIINNLPVPEVLSLSGKKPWEIKHLDTMEMWKFGDYKHFTSLELLAAILNIESSKDDIDGSQVNEVYYGENDLERISEYCKRDVVVLAQVFLRLNQMPTLPKERITLL